MNKKIHKDKKNYIFFRIIMLIAEVQKRYRTL